MFANLFGKSWRVPLRPPNCDSYIKKHQRLHASRFTGGLLEPATQKHPSTCPSVNAQTAMRTVPVIEETLVPDTVGRHCSDSNAALDWVYPTFRLGAHKQQVGRNQAYVH